MSRLPTQVLPPVLASVEQAIIACDRCSRLRSYCEEIGLKKRRAYLHEDYWARPVAGFGDPHAKILLLGLAPGAHGANRTGRVFTGDGSGDFLFPVLNELSLASQAAATHRGDGLKLQQTWIGCVVRCAPPGDKPTPEEVRNCSQHLAAEIAALPRLRVVVCLGKIAWDGYLALLVRTAVIIKRSQFIFGHGVVYVLPNGLHLLGVYHPSLRNTNTGRLNAPMLARVLLQAKKLAEVD